MVERSLEKSKALPPLYVIGKVKGFRFTLQFLSLQSVPFETVSIQGFSPFWDARERG